MDATRTLERCWSEIGVLGQGDRSCAELAAVRHCRNCPVYRAAGRGLLDRPLDEVAQRDWTQAVAQPPARHHRTTRSAMVFRVGSEWMGIPALVCQEVTEWRPVLRLPQTRQGRVGLVNIHGRLEVCVDLAQVLGHAEGAFDEDDAASHRRFILVARGGERFALPVAQVHGAARYRPESLAPVPDTVAHCPSSFAAGWFQTDIGRVICLDPDRLFPALEACLA